LPVELLVGNMQALEFDSLCPDCLKPLLDAGDELVCPTCGVAKEKLVVQTVIPEPVGMPPLGKQALGSYMGSLGITSEERRSKGITGTSSKYEYLKVVSDFAGRNEGTFAICVKTIERVGEKLRLPRFVLLEAASIARKVLAIEHPHRRITVASVSAYSLIYACKVAGITSVSIGEIIGAHVAIGRTVTSSSIIRLAFDSPVRAHARRPDDYLSRVLARLSMNERLAGILRRERVLQTVFFTELRDTARMLLGLLGEEARLGRRPCALAASAVYSAEMVLSECESRRRRLTQREIAECGDTAEYTVREQCARLFAPAVEALTARKKQALPPASAH
jgi:transcription initiation factor TFIIIB Brf1 subunit/transcription initiation factor TFIIB